MTFRIMILNNYCNLILQYEFFQFMQDFLRKNIHRLLSIDILIKHFIYYSKNNFLKYFLQRSKNNLNIINNKIHYKSVGFSFYKVKNFSEI